MKPKSSSDMPDKLMRAAEDATADVQVDLLSKLGPVVEGMLPTERTPLMAAAAALAGMIAGQPMKAKGSPEDLQTLAVALTAANAYRESKGEPPLDLEAVAPLMLMTMFEDLLRDEDFADFLAAEVEGEDEREDTEEVEDMEEMPMTGAPPSNRRATLMGAM